MPYSSYCQANFLKKLTAFVVRVG